MDAMAESIPGAEKFCTVTHKSGKSRWLTCINGEWTPLGPEWPTFQDAVMALQRTALIANEMREQSLIGFIQRVDKATIEAGQMHYSNIPDSEWVAAFHELQAKEASQVNPGAAKTLPIDFLNN